MYGWIFRHLPGPRTPGHVRLGAHHPHVLAHPSRIGNRAELLLQRALRGGAVGGEAAEAGCLAGRGRLEREDEGDEQKCGRESAMHPASVSAPRCDTQASRQEMRAELRAW